MVRAAWLLLALAAAFTAGATRAERRHGGIALPYPELLHPEPPLSFPEGFTLEQRLPLLAPQGVGPINLPRQVSASLARCWSAPGSQAGRRLEATVRLSFRADGSLIGPPVFTYVDAAFATRLREDVTRSIRDAILACTPLPFTAALGSAIAGRPLTIHFVAHPNQTSKETPI